MSNQPFKDEDVVLRFPQDAYSFERVFTRDPFQSFGINMYWNVGGKWCPCLPNLQDVAEIVRQLAEKDRRLAELEERVDYLRFGISYARNMVTDKEHIQSYLMDRLNAEDHAVAEQLQGKSDE